MDKEFTQKMFEWLNTPKEKRNLAAGALMVLQCDRNKVLYNNVMRMPAKYADIIEYNMKKWYKFRLQHTTHEQVEEMAREAAAIVEKHNLNVPADQDTAQGDQDTAPADEKRETNQVGKRVDHDQLPLEVQALYVENRDILNRMREVHLRLRKMSEDYKDRQVCPDSDRFPFLQELITLDKTYHANWEKYDTYVIGQQENKVERQDKNADKSAETKKTSKTAAPKKAAKKDTKTPAKKGSKDPAKKKTAAKAKK